jgi:hypothetical protein
VMLVSRPSNALQVRHWTRSVRRRKVETCGLRTHTCRVGCKDAHGLRAGAVITVLGGRSTEGRSP